VTLGVGDLGPDEACYWQQGSLVRERGAIAGVRTLTERFLGEPGAYNYPSPLRWLWIWLAAIAMPVRRNALGIVSALCIPFAVAWALHPLGASWTSAALVAASPLLWQLGGRALQDVTVALFAALMIGAATHGIVIGFAASVFCLLSIKEASALLVPVALLAAWLSGQDALALGAAGAIGALVALLVMRAIVGPNTLRVFRKAKLAHGNEYAKTHQSGAPHRLLVDLTLVSPAVALAFCATSPSLPIVMLVAATIALHDLAPIRNVRTILIVDLVARCWVATQLGAIAIPLLAVDAYVYTRIRHIYDPVTSELTRALGMSP